MEKPSDALSERTIVAEKLVKCLRESFSEIESRQRNLDLARESVVERMMEIECMRESLEKRSRELDEREKQFDAFREGKKRKLVSEEEDLSLKKREKFLNGVKGREEELNEQLKKIESQEQDLRSARESLAERERKVEIIIGTLDGRITAVEEKEKEFRLFLAVKMRELASKEEELRMKREEFVNEINLADEKFREQEKLRDGYAERIEMAEKKLEGVRAKIDERFKEIEFRENVAWESVSAGVVEADLIRESNQFEEFEKRKIECSSLLEDKMQELFLKEQQLDKMSKELVKDAELRDEQLVEREKLGHKLLKRLELAQDNVENLKNMVHERFKEIALKEARVNSTSDWIERTMDEVDLKKIELEDRENRIIRKKDHVISKRNELLRKEKKLDLKKKNLLSWGKELEVEQREVDSVHKLNEQRSEELDWREKNLNSVRDFIRNCFKEHLAIKKKLHFERDLVDRHARDLELREQQLEYMVRELEKQEGSVDVLNAHVKTEAIESADLKFIVRMDGKTLQMFLNDPEKDLESMGDEIFQVLHLSSDPAKLVLDAMVGFYPSHLREGDVEFNVRRTCIILLEQLIKMSWKIQPYVREEALELASAWKSKMRATAENHLEVLGFLHLLAAYNLASCFQEDEIFSFLMMVAQHRQTPELCRVLGFTESILENWERRQMNDTV